MKTTIKLLTVLALALVVFGQHTIASAGGGTNNGHFRDLGSNAYFYSVDPSGCVTTEVYLFASQHYFQSPSAPSSEGPFVSFQIFQRDVCTGIALINASGATEDLDLQVDSKLNSATLYATVNAWEGVSQTFQDMYLDLSWAASAPALRVHNHYHFNSPGCHLMSRSNGLYRPATAWGSVSDGLTNFTPDPAQGAEIFSTVSGNLLVGCN